MKKNQEGFVPVIIILIVLIGFVGVYYLGRLNPKKEVSNPTASPVATVVESSKPTVLTTTPTSDPTANWKVYSGDRFKFSYPNDWNYYQPKVEGNMFSLYIAPKDTIEDIAEMFGRGGGFGGGKFLTLSISEVNEMPTYKSDEYLKITSSTYKLDGINSTRYFADALQSMPGLDAGDKTERIVFQKDNKKYVINLVDYQYKKTFDQILSTFKFTN